MGKSKYAADPCYICGLKMPVVGRYHPFPWHITCDNDEAGKKKVAVWKREQKKAEIPTLLPPE